MPETPAIDINNLSVRFGDKSVLEGFSLSLMAGDKVSLTGRSGCGKSTLLRCLLGFVPWQAGRLAIEGMALTAESVWNVRRRLAYVPQEPQLGRGSAREAIEAPFAYRANSALRGNLARVGEMFERYQLEARLLEEPVGNLSGGEKQRVVLIAALLLKRPILLLDEASSALDPASKAAVAADIAARKELTVLSISHDARGFDLGGRIAGIETMMHAEEARR